MIPPTRFRLFLALLAFLLATGSMARSAETRRLEVLFFGDDAYHHPLERYRIFKEVTGTRGINLTYEKRMEALNDGNLARFDVILVYANHQEITASQLDALETFVENGGGFVPVHCGSACFKNNDRYVDLVGGQIEGHGEGVFSARVVEPEHPALQGYEPFETWDETYRHHRLNDDITVLQRHGDEPWTWVREQGDGRVFYTAHGHDERCWRQDGFHELLTRGIRWAAGDDVPHPDLPELVYEQPLIPEPYQASREIPKAQEPLSPEESLKLAQVPPGFEISVFASEPDIINPIAIAWDHRGRLWVIESLDYPNNLRTGKTGNDRLTICEDTDGDGRADTFTVFADNLSLATSLVHADGGVIVVDGPEIVFLKDNDGDDRVDERTVLFSGIKTHDTHAGVSNLKYGFDGWIYATIGYAGFEGRVAGETVRFDTGVFRFRPDGTALEFLEKTTNNTWGLGFTETFDVVGSTANRHPSWQVVGDGGDTRRADTGTLVYPTTRDVQQSDGWDPPVIELGNGRTSARARHFTAAAGHAVYTAARFPESDRNRAVFVCEATGHLVATGRLRNENADLFTEFEGENLYASADAWSAPVAAEVGPDGAVWIADWYNIIVQHWRPGMPFEHIEVNRGPGAAYITPLREKPLGRIYRVRPRNSAEPQTPRLDPAHPETLIAALDHDNLFWRLHAQRLLVEQSLTDAVLRPLRTLALSDSGHGGYHALRVLHQNGSADTRLLATALRDENPGRRRLALELWPTTALPDFDVLAEKDPFVQRAWLLLAAKVPPDEALGRKLRDWHRDARHLRKGEILDRCFALAAANHATGFLLASLETLPAPEVLDGRIYPSAIRAFAAHPSARVLQALRTQDSFLARHLRGVDAAQPPKKRHDVPLARLARGEALYSRSCVACHQADGRGVAGAFPPLDGSQRVTDNWASVVRIITGGLTGPVATSNGTINSVMPPVPGLSDSEIADLLTYIRHSWDNDATPVSAEEISVILEETPKRTTLWTVEELDEHP